MKEYVSPESELPLPSTITVFQGRKSSGDKIVKIHGHAITFYELSHVFLMMFNSEDANYPPPFLRGGDMILDMIKDVRKLGKITPYLCKKYQIPLKESE